MKARTKVLLTSIAFIAMCASIAVGGTYALFTDKATVNVAVTSATVDVEATIVKNSLTTYSRGVVQEQGFFANDPELMPGATFDEDDNLVLMNITPGDKVEFEIAVTNNSNVDIQYRTVAYVTGALADHLVWTSSVSDWTYVESNKDIANVEVSVEFPEEVTYDDLGGIAEYNATVAFTVEAVQGNGDTGFDYRGGVYYVSNVEGLYKFAKSVNEGTSYADETILLTSNLDLNNQAWTPIGVWKDNAFEGTFDGQGYTISNMKLDDTTAFCVGLFGLTDGATIQNVNIKNVNYNIDQQVGAVVGYAMGKTTTITNCHVSGSISMVANYAYAGGIVSDGFVNVSNCSVIADGMSVIKAVEKNVAGGIIGYLNNGVIDSCVVENLDIEGWTNVGAIAGFTLSGTTVSNNTAKNVNLTKTRLGGTPAIGLATGGWCYSATKATTITNNSFANVVLNALSKEYAVDNTIMFGGEYGGSTDSSCLVVSGNTMTNITDNRTLYV